MNKCDYSLSTGETTVYKNLRLQYSEEAYDQVWLQYNNYHVWQKYINKVWLKYMTTCHLSTYISVTKVCETYEYSKSKVCFKTVIKTMCDCTVWTSVITP